MDGADPYAAAAVPRGAVTALLDEAAARATLAAHGGVAIVVASGATLARLRGVAVAAVDDFARDLVATPSGARAAALARDELATPASTWVLFAARPAPGDERARLVAAATAAAALRMSARWCGLAARACTAVHLASPAITARLACEAGSWFDEAELAALVALSPGGVSSTIPPVDGAAAPWGLPVLWLGEGDRLAAPAAYDADPPAWPAGGPPRVALYECGPYASVLTAALTAAGCTVLDAPDASPARVPDAAALDLTVVGADTSAGREAIAAHARGRDARTPVLAVSGYGHDDVRLVATRAGASAVVRLPAQRRELLRVVHDLVSAKRLLDTARRHGAELHEAQSALVRSERMATLGWLAAGVGHDLRTPLGSIRSNSELALKVLARMARDIAGRDDDLARCVLTVTELEQTNLRAVDRLGEIVAGLKAVARSDEGSAASVAVPEVVEQVLALCARELCHVRVERSLPPGLPPVRGRPAELLQLVMNLVVNAAHALPANGRIEVSAALREPGGVVLTVADNGPGIDPAVQARLFRPGFTTKAAAGGSGLGLSIVKRIVDANGGTIQVESAPGAGARFRVVLPRARDAAS